jgi:hypothetical protein
MTYTSWEAWLYDFTATNYVIRFSDNQWTNGVKDVYVTLEYTKTTDLPKIEFVGGSGADIYVSGETLHIDNGDVEINGTTITINENIEIDKEVMIIE